MQVVILAAGMGKRLKHLTKDNTKCMLSVNGYALIDRMLDIVTSFDISRIVIVLGYKGENVQKKLGTEYHGTPIVYVYNKDYATTNNIYSLWLASDYLKDDDTLLFESDLIFEKQIVEKLISNEYPNLAVVDKYRAWMDGTVVKISEDREILSLIPKEHFNYQEVDSYYKTVNIYKFSSGFMRDYYLPFLNAYCRSLGNNQYYEQVLRVIVTLEQKNLKAMPLNGEKWYEIDDEQDLSHAEAIFANSTSEKLKLFSSRYGGYWRFDGLQDYCYLVNPYFPPQRMIEEIKYSFENLLRDYPSGQKIQDLLAANMFDFDKDLIAVGNGAAEIISAAMNQSLGKVGMMIPTFQEYPARLAKENFVPLQAKEPDFSYTVEDLKASAEKIDTLILINPDNPSGNLIPYTDLLDLIEFYKKENKKIIVDESFVDFSDKTVQATIIKHEIVDKYDNLLIVKSISKSYGVPGLRLGIAVSSNKEWITEIRNSLAIWNINSFGEFFLQLIDKYKKTYYTACEKIVEARNEFFKALSDISFLRVIPSQSNYFLCVVKAPWNSKELTEYLLEKHNILIKDCSAKLGFDGKSYVRIAIKSKEENSLLVNYLSAL